MDYKRMPPHGLRWMFFSRQNLVQGNLHCLLRVWWVSPWPPIFVAGKESCLTWRQQHTQFLKALVHPTL